MKYEIMKYENIIIDYMDILIEYSNQNGHIRLIKEKYRYLGKWNIPMDRNKVTQFKVQYSSNGQDWSTCAKYKSTAKVIHSKYFHKLAAALKNGTKLQLAKI